MRHLFIAALCMFSLAPNALAQSQASSPTPDQLRAQAEEMIATGGTGEFFVPEDRPPAVTLRHTRSGLLCRFLFGEEGQTVSIVPSTSLGVAHGDDVACGSTNQLSAVTIYATRRSDHPNADQALADAVAALRTVHANAQPVDLATIPTPGNQPSAQPEGSRSAAFTINAGGQQLFTRVSVFVRDGWTYKMRFTSPYPSTNMLADMLWNTAINELAPVAATP